MDAGRRLVYRFFSLSHHHRTAVIQALGLVERGDQGESEMERFRRSFRQAKEKGLLALLWSEVEALHPDGDVTHNPFVAG